MINKIKIACITASIIPTLATATNAVVNTDMLLVKKSPSNYSSTSKYYERNKTIEVFEKVSGKGNSSVWYKTNNGFVKAKYITILKDTAIIQKPKYEEPEYTQELNNNFDNNKNVQIVQNKVKNTRKVLAYNSIDKEVNENIQDIKIKKINKIEKIKKINNIKKIDSFDHYTKNNKAQEVSNNIANLNKTMKIKKDKKKVKAFNQEDILKSFANVNDDVKSSMDGNDIINGFSSIQDTKKTEVSNNLKNIQKIRQEAEVSKKDEIVLEEKVVLKRPDTNGIKQIREIQEPRTIQSTPSYVMPQQTNKVLDTSYEGMLENMLINLNK